MKNKLFFISFIIILIFLNFDISYGFSFETISKRSSWFSFLSETIPSNYINVIKEDDFYGSVFIGTNNGLVWTNGKRFKLYGTKKIEGPIGKNINDIVFYKKTGIYVATDSGLSIFEYSNSLWRHYTKKEKLPTNYIESIDRYRNFLLIGTWGKGLYSLNMTTNKINKVNIPQFMGTYITDILVDEKNRTIIVSSFKHGIAIKKNKKWSLFSITKKKLPSNRVNCLAGDGKLFYVGTNSGIVEFSKGGSKIISTIDGLKSDNILSLWCSKNYELWVGTDKGVSHILGGEIKNFPIKNSLFNGRLLRVSAILKLDKITYFGTEHGGLLIKRR